MPPLLPIAPLPMEEAAEKSGKTLIHAVISLRGFVLMAWRHSVLGAMMSALLHPTEAHAV